MKINEIWQKGYPTRQQAFRILSNALRSVAISVELSPRDADEIIVEMYLHDFIDTFGARGASDKILTMISSADREIEKSFIGNGADDWSPDRHLKSLQAHRKASGMFEKILQSAIVRSRSLIPLGWMLKAPFTDIGLGYLQSNGKIKMRVVRDMSPKENSPMKKYWHVTLAKNIDSIIHDGLVPKSNRRPGFMGYRNRIYLSKINPSDDHEFVIYLITGSMFLPTRESMSSEISVLEVTIPDGVEVYRDPEYNSGVYVEQPIPAENINVTYTGTLQDYLA